MDDQGNEEELDDDTVFRLTPKGFYESQLMKFGASIEQAEEAWFELEAYCVKLGKEACSDSSHAALVFDGHGGEVFGFDYIPGGNEFDATGG
jgi:hypothetical protein